MSAVKPFRVKRYSIVCIRNIHPRSGETPLPPPFLMTTSTIDSCSIATSKKKKQKQKHESCNWQWLEPMPNSDDAPFALIGQKIRCILPKILPTENMAPPKTSTSESHSSSYSRMIEGEVISEMRQQIGSTSTPSFQLSVKLLVETKMLSSLSPCIKEKLEGDTDKSKHTDSIDNHVHKENTSKIAIEKRRRKLELKIQGEDKTIIQLRLPLPLHYVCKAKTSTTEGNTDQTANSITVVHWVIRKYVEINTDGIDVDEESQQENNNIRWIISKNRCGRYLLPRSATETQFPLRFGEVVDILPAPQLQKNASQGESKRMKGKTKSPYATVFIRPLGCLENCNTGRMAHHLWNELVDLKNIKAIGGCDGYMNIETGDRDGLVEVPIEDLIVVGRRARRIYGRHSLKGYDVKARVGEKDMIIRYKYDIAKGQFHPLHENGGTPKQKDIFGDENDVGVSSNSKEFQLCHRCKVVEHEQNMGQCQSKHCGSGMNTCESAHKWWCWQCVELLRKRGAFVLRKKESEWYGPCCLGSCDCFDCTGYSSCRYPFEKTLLNCSLRYNTASPMEHSNGATIEGEELTNCVQFSRTCFKYWFVCSICRQSYHQDCYMWWMTLEQEIGREKMDRMLPSSSGEGIAEFECLICRKSRGSHPCKGAGIRDSNNPPQNPLQVMVDIVDCLPPSDFSLPLDFLHVPTISTAETSSLETRRPTKRPKKEPPDTSKGANSSKVTKTSEPNCAMRNDNGHHSVSCSRILPYDASKFNTRSMNNSAVHAARSLASMRCGGRKAVSRSARGEKQGSDKKNSSRAARANQRRMLKDVASFGFVKDNLSGCEHALRFGKSIIHGWGVFSDEQISTGDLILEYRGVLIGNAVADKREREYEMAKIGSDYMFRIDSSKVCDATHQGNLARFINASCSPNCYTQIITINGMKRIAIYAKKDIKPGEELSYDYKFEPEFSVSQRIPCNCGMPDCKGFLNWDKRYVAIKTS